MQESVGGFQAKLGELRTITTEMELHMIPRCSSTEQAAWARRKKQLTLVHKPLTYYLGITVASASETAS